MEPPGRVEFSNSSGGWLDCSASGSPQPTIDWVHADGSAVTEIHGVRRVLRNGTLVLMPFAAAAYHQDVHNTIYRCIASNSVGRIVSRDVQVRAGKLVAHIGTRGCILKFISLAGSVVAQAYKVDVEVLSASRGCTAILRCVVPTFVKELVRVVSWVHEPAIYIYPSLQGGKYPGGIRCLIVLLLLTSRNWKDTKLEGDSTQLVCILVPVAANKVHCLFAVFASHVCLLNCHFHLHHSVRRPQSFPLVHN